jgi:hypothetical protein
MVSKEPAIYEGLAWWSIQVVVPLAMASIELIREL